MKIDFPLLTKDDIEVRAGNYNGDKSKVNLLLYKTARTDAKYLDDVLGSYNWQKEYTMLEGKLYCTISIWDDEKKQWIKKQDVGVESNTEAEKGQASDAMKRAATMVGIGRELYTAPNIWVEVKHKYFEVVEIGYNERREISKLSIKDTQTGEIVFSLGMGGAKGSNTNPARTDYGRLGLIASINKFLIKKPEKKEYFFKWLKDEYNVASVNELEEDKIKEICERLKIGGNNG